MSREYQAYLLRFERNRRQVHWRVYVENAETGEVLRFATEWELIHFLLQRLLTFPNELNDSTVQ